MALNTDYAIRTGAFEPASGSRIQGKPEELQKKAFERYNTLKVIQTFLQYFISLGQFQ